MTRQPRQFTITPATRSQVPLIIGISGPSHSGKTKSALRIGQGIAGHSGLPMAVIDTEHGRAKFFADEHTFHHVPFDEPYSPLAYLDAVHQCVHGGFGVIVIDSMSHEHEGMGGVLDMHETHLEGLSYAKRQRANFSAWIQPKRQRTQLLNGLVRCGAHIILCFRAKQKIKPVPGQEPKQLGWMPIGGEEFAYECTVYASLHPHANGIPTWSPQQGGEGAMIKRPAHLREYLPDGAQLCERMGEDLARWAAGTPDPRADLRTAWKAAKSAGKDTLRRMKELAEQHLGTSRGDELAKMDDATIAAALPMIRAGMEKAQ